jgi:integrase
MNCAVLRSSRLGSPAPAAGRRHPVDRIERIRKAAGLDDVRLHDLRHAFASIAASSGLGLPIIGKMLGHSQPATTARYAHLASDPVKAAAAAVAGKIAAAMGGGKGGEAAATVVTLRPGA